MKPLSSYLGRRKQIVDSLLIVAGMVPVWSLSAVAEESAKNAAVEPAAEDAELPPNWVDLTIGAYAMGGDSDDAAFQRRWQNSGDFYGGIESFHYEQEAGSGTFTADGHALFGLDDYEVDLKYSIDDIGFIRGGYREFSTWYDGSGGYLPGAATPTGWDDPITDYGDELSVDRGELFFEAGLTMENLPIITFGYTHRWRDGQKNSSMWGIGDTIGLYGIDYSGSIDERGVVPTLSDLDEVSDIFTLDVSHTLGNTDLGMALRYQKDDNDNERSALGGETIQHDTYGADLFSGILTSETRFGEKAMVSVGYLYTTMDTDTDGSFRQSEDHSTHVVTKNFIWGGANFQQHVVNGSLWWNPIPDLVIVPSLRAEWEDTDAESGYGLTYGSASSKYSSVTDILNLNEEIELRYTGLENLVLYANAELMQGEEDLEIQQSSATTLLHERDGDIDTDFQKYSLGANWYPLSRVSISTQYYYSQLDQDLDYGYPLVNGVPQPTPTNPTLDGILSAHSVETNDFNFRINWRALDNLTLTTRYDYKRSKIENQSLYNSLATLSTPALTSGDVTSHIISQSVTWNVNSRLYLQGGFNWINSQTDTPTDSDTNNLDSGLVPDWDNDYWCVTINGGYALAENTDLLFGYQYSSAENYLNDSTVTVPYGLQSQDHAFTLSLVQRINENMTANIRYGWFCGDDDASGGFNDYEAHMVSSGLQIRF